MACDFCLNHSRFRLPARPSLHYSIHLFFRGDLLIKCPQKPQILIHMHYFIYKNSQYKQITSSKRQLPTETSTDNFYIVPGYMYCIIYSNLSQSRVPTQTRTSVNPTSQFKCESVRSAFNNRKELTRVAFLL